MPKIIVHLAVELHSPDQPEGADPDEYRTGYLEALRIAVQEHGPGTVVLIAHSAYAVTPPLPDVPPAEPGDEETP